MTTDGTYSWITSSSPALLTPILDGMTYLAAREKVLKRNPYGYVPTEWICILFVVLFSVSTGMSMVSISSRRHDTPHPSIRSPSRWTGHPMPSMVAPDHPMCRWDT